MKAVRFFAVLAACGCLVGAGAAVGSAQIVAPINPAVFYDLNPDGSGQLSLGGVDTGGVTWQACRGAGTTTCVPYASGGFIGTGNVPAGTFFVASTSAGQIATSPVWLGDVASSAPPRVLGRVRANDLVTGLAGGWSGGWQSADTSDSIELAACANADGTECTSLTATNYIYACDDGYGAVIDPAFTGWYLRVADQHNESNELPPGVILISNSPYIPYVWPASPTTSVAVVGRIAPADTSRITSCGGPPLPSNADPHDPKYHCPKRLPECPVADISPSGDVDVWCAFYKCQPIARLRRGPRTVVLRPVTSVDQRPAPIAIRVSRAERKRLGPGPAIESVYVLGVRLARRRVSIS